MHSSPGATADLKVATTNFTAAPGAEGNVSSGGGLDSRRGPEFRSGLATSCGRASREPSANLRRDLFRDEETGDARSITELIWTAKGPAAFKRLGRALPAVSPRTRTRLLAGFLSINLVAALLGQAQRLGWLGTSPWLRQLDSSPEGTLANSYSVVVWSAVAVLALAQLCRSTPGGSRRRFQVLGWLSLALIADRSHTVAGLSRKSCARPEGCDWPAYSSGWTCRGATPGRVSTKRPLLTRHTFEGQG